MRPARQHAPQRHSQRSQQPNSSSTFQAMRAHSHRSCVRCHSATAAAAACAFIIVVHVVHLKSLAWDVAVSVCAARGISSCGVAAGEREATDRWSWQPAIARRCSPACLLEHAIQQGGNVQVRSKQAFHAACVHGQARLLHTCHRPMPPPHQCLKPGGRRGCVAFDSKAGPSVLPSESPNQCPAQ
jgi:hypothetical protein